MTTDEFLTRLEQFDPATDSAAILAFIQGAYPLVRDQLTEAERAWVSDQASTASMAVALSDERVAAPAAGAAPSSPTS